MHSEASLSQRVARCPPAPQRLGTAGGSVRAGQQQRVASGAILLAIAFYLLLLPPLPLARGVLPEAHPLHLPSNRSTYYQEREDFLQRQRAAQAVHAIFETPHNCRLQRHHPQLADFLETRLRAYSNVQWHPTGVDPRIIFLKGSKVQAVARLTGKTPHEIHTLLANNGVLPAGHRAKVSEHKEDL